MTKILHISDLHFGPPYIEVVGQALIKTAPSLQVDAIVVTGDLTQRAKEHQFKAVRDFLAKLPGVPKLVIPGNHDVPLYRVVERLRDPHGLYRKYICDDLNPALQLDGAIIAGLDSTAPHLSISGGRLHLKQLKHCREVFENAEPGSIRVVATHHHFVPAPDYRSNLTMQKTRRAIDRFVDMGVELILGGHLHRSYIGNSLSFFPGNHRDQGIIIVQAGTATSSCGLGRERGKNSFNLVEIDSQMLRITHYMFFESSEEFAPVSRHLFPRPGKQFVEKNVWENTKEDSSMVEADNIQARGSHAYLPDI
ncbi:MAG TPA: 3',5'-cyclic-nucleotide phosphodiesterase [Peptococcaceae bacterium]|nr:3',5'-cyclic-nucleotide phosphodiesterase [Peptococcaceae bacterium]